MSEPSPAARFFGWLLTILGGLWVLLTGGCTLTLITVMLPEIARGASDGVRMILMYLAIGAACLAPGAVLLAVGLFLLRRKKAAGGER